MVDVHVPGESTDKHVKHINANSAKIRKKVLILAKIPGLVLYSSEKLDLAL